MVLTIDFADFYNQKDIKAIDQWFRDAFNVNVKKFWKFCIKSIFIQRFLICKFDIKFIKLKLIC